MRRRRRVLHVITRLIVGGAQENTLASVVRVDPTRFESVLWTGPQTGEEGSLFEEAEARGVRLRTLPSLLREPAPAADFRVTREMVALLRSEPFDVVHTHCSKAGILGRVAARIARVPIVLHTAHGWGFHDHMSPLKKSVYVGSERLAARWTDRIISVSEETTRVGVQHGVGRESGYVLIRSGIPLDRFGPSPEERRRTRHALGVAEDEVVVTSVGRLSAQKNPAHFVELAERVVAVAPQARFLYVGDGPMRPEIEARLAGSPAGSAVRLLGLRSDVPDLLRASDVFVLTSLWEGLPRVVPQALATGVPVLAYDVAGTREIVRQGRNGFLVPPGDVAAMAGHVASLVVDGPARRAMAARALDEFDDSFSEDAMIRGLEELYTEMCARFPE